jgi:hypothetical protein
MKRITQVMLLAMLALCLGSCASSAHKKFEERQNEIRIKTDEKRKAAQEIVDAKAKAIAQETNIDTLLRERTKVGNDVRMMATSRDFSDVGVTDIYYDLYNKIDARLKELATADPKVKERLSEQNWKESKQFVQGVRDSAVDCVDKAIQFLTKGDIIQTRSWLIVAIGVHKEAIKAALDERDKEKNKVLIDYLTRASAQLSKLARNTDEIDEYNKKGPKIMVAEKQKAGSLFPKFTLQSDPANTVDRAFSGREMEGKAKDNKDIQNDIIKILQEYKVQSNLKSN